MTKEKYYTLDKILSNNADYNIIYGERSNGKTTAVLLYGLRNYIKSNYINQLAIVRRWDTDFKGKNASTMFDGIIQMGVIDRETNGLFNSVYYYSERWYLCHINEDGERDLLSPQPFAYAFAINCEEHYKSTSYPNIKTILFDEFITRNMYLPEEFVRFTSILSTIIRLRDDVKIFMCGNTINKYCPYFAEMGLKNVKNQKKGTIDLYSYGDSGLIVAVEYSDMPAKKKKSNKYFAFDNPDLKMITEGSWEISLYPHLPKKYLPKEVMYMFFVIFDRDILQGNVIISGEEMFVYMHRKTTPIKEDNENLVYQQEVNFKNNYRVNFLKPYEKIDTILKKLYVTNNFFYQDNEVGEIFYNYIKWCKSREL